MTGENVQLLICGYNMSSCVQMIYNDIYLFSQLPAHSLRSPKRNVIE